MKRERLERLNELQRLITAERYERALGRTVRAIVDRVDDGDGAGAHACGRRTTSTASRYVDGAERLAPGTFVDVALDEVVDDVDFRAHARPRRRRRRAARARRARALPVLGDIDRQLRTMSA